MGCLERLGFALRVAEEHPFLFEIALVHTLGGVRVSVSFSKFFLAVLYLATRWALSDLRCIGWL